MRSETEVRRGVVDTLLGQPQDYRRTGLKAYADEVVVVGEVQACDSADSDVAVAAMQLGLVLPGLHNRLPASPLRTRNHLGDQYDGCRCHLCH